MNAVAEDAAAPTAAVGTLVSALVDFSSPSGQVDNVVDLDLGAVLGIAVTAADSANGAWWYSTDNGTNWNALGAVSNSASRLLAADADTRIYFEPDANYNGTLTSAISFRAWDRTSGSNGGTADTTVNGGLTAFSTATDTASLTVIAVNDAPVVAGLNGDSLAYAEGDGAVVVEQGGDAGVSDVDSADVDGGTLTVSLDAGGDSAEDVLAIRHQGTGVGQIGVSGSNVAYGGATIGTFSGGSGGSDLVVSFNGSATPAALQALARNISYENTDANAPTTGARTVRFVLTDGDGGTSANHDAIVTVAAVDDAPVVSASASTLAYTENDTATAIDPALAVSDADSTNLDGATVTVSANHVNGQDVLAFSDQLGITGSWNAGTGVLTLSGSTTVANYQTALRSVTYANTSDNPSTPTRTLSFVVDDGATSSSVATRDISVTAVNDAPIVTSHGGGATASASVAENTAAVATVTSSDVDGGAAVYSIVGGVDAARFTIDASTGALSFVAAPDYEAPVDAGSNNVYDVTVQVSDGTLADAQAIAVTVTAANDNAPAITSNGGGATASLSIAENSTAVTTVSGSDADLPAPALSYSIAGGADAARFTIDASTGVLSFVAAPDYEAPVDAGANNVYDVTVQVSDGSLIDTQAIAATVTAANDNAPVITSNGGGATASLSIAENSTAVTTLGATDADLPAQTLTYWIVGGADAALFTINSTTGALSFVAAPDYEAPADTGADNAYDVTVQVSDGSLTDTQAIVVAVTATNDNAPTITSHGGGASASVNVAEQGTAVATITATDADLPAQTLTYSITGGADAARFTIDGSSGALSFVAAPDHEAPVDAGADNVYEVTVRVADGNGGTDSQTIAVTVTNVNDAPVNTVPGAQNTNEDTALVFSPGNGNPISIGDVDAGVNTVEVTLIATNGTTTLNLPDGPGNAASSEVRVNTTTAGTQQTTIESNQAVALAPNGNFVVVWTGLDANANGVFARLYDTNGVALSGEIQVNTTTANNQQHASVAVDADGNFVVVWTSEGQAGDNVNATNTYARRFDAAAAALGGEVRSIPRHHRVRPPRPWR